MTTPTQLGTTVLVGFMGHTYTAVIMDSAKLAVTGDQDEIRSEDNETCTVIVSNKGTQIDFSGVIKGSTVVTPPAKGSSVTVNSVIYRVLDSSVEYSRLAAKLTVSAIKEDSMTYT